ncbi:HNH endonuclease signature motif containing protein [Xanthomonas citri]|uniref:HNH endonuclease signature motif containing protein n=1 Tax=Xanthomonas citri TaxID=346 RepID=UPI000B322F0A|nr:HNH endonuclease signature motif containing protein [Xanthomonas citri]QTK37306.1 HNH endonuclease [Xanthomonas citri pv. glycines]
MSAVPCKEHTGATNPGGYGVVRHEGKPQLAHRVAYCAFHGISITRIKGLVIRHECDNRRCVEPLHLRVGTQADNVNDMMRRKRHRYTPLPARSGTAHATAKLDYTKVREIRAAYAKGAKQKHLANKYGVSQSLISYVVNNKGWDEAVGQINAKIAPLTITADGLAQLGFLPVTTERASKLYDAAQLAAMFSAMQQVFARAATSSYQQAA